MNKFLSIFSLLIVLVICFSCLEEYQPPVFRAGGVRGLVKDVNDNVLDDAIIYTIPWTYADTSNASGRFEISDLGKDEYFVFAEKEGYQLSKQKVKITSGEVEEIVFFLEKIIVHNSPPIPPSLLYPDNGKTDVRDSILLQWSKSPDANGDSVFYDVYADKNATPITKLFSAITDTFCMVRNLESSSSYYWRVYATDKKSSSPSVIRRFNTAGDVQYKVLPSQGKLPYPHHNPKYTQEEYDNMMDQLWIVDNFADYVPCNPVNESYICTGLKIKVSDRHPIFSITNGIVRIKNSIDLEKSFIVIEDLDNPGYAWKYEGLENFQYNLGDYVQMGNQIGQISNISEGYYTISRIKKTEGIVWGRQEWSYIYCQQNFEIKDSKKPIQFGSLFMLHGNTKYGTYVPSIPRTYTVSGEVDIVYDVRDAGEYAEPGYVTEDSLEVDNTAVTRFECWLTNMGGKEFPIETYDFREIELSGYEVFDIYFDQYLRPLVDPEDVYFHKFCILSNVKRVNGKLQVDFNYNWNTTEKDAEGNSLYPNGKYVMEVRAYDDADNFCKRRDTVIIRN
jgi:hypothetical protein